MERRVSFIHCADIHLDMPFKSMRQKALSMERRKDLKKTLEKIVSLALEKEVDALVISGDLYEHNYIKRSTIHWANEQFKKLGDKSVIIVPGNHDPYVKNSWYRIYPWHTNVCVLSTKNPCYTDEEKNIFYYGIGFDTFRQETIPSFKVPKLSSDKMNICLFHGTIDMAFTQQAYNPVDSKELQNMGFDYIAAGHFHKRDETLKTTGIINPGSPEPLGFDEQGEHGVYWVCLTKKEGIVHRECRFIPVQQRKYCDLNLNVEGLETQRQIQKKLAELLKGDHYKNDIVRVNFTGRLSPGFRIDIKSLEEFFKGECFFVKFTDDTRPDYEIELLSGERNLTGEFISKMQDKIEKAKGEEKQLLEKALYLGLEALLEEKVEL